MVSILTQENFDSLLEWLSPEREAAGQQYEAIRTGLIRYFRFRGCEDPEDLADETINRVASKLSTFNFDKGVKKITYFYGFASRILLEDIARRKKRMISLEDEPDLLDKPHSDPDVPDESGFECLEKCLAGRRSGERDLVVRYYTGERSEKLEIRKRLAEEMQLNPAALHTRLHRIRLSLRQCVQDCICGRL